MATIVDSSTWNDPEWINCDSEPEDDSAPGFNYAAASIRCVGERPRKKRCTRVTAGSQTGDGTPDSPITIEDSISAPFAVEMLEKATKYLPGGSLHPTHASIVLGQIHAGKFDLLDSLDGIKAFAKSIEHSLAAWRDSQKKYAEGMMTKR